MIVLRSDANDFLLEQLSRSGDEELTYPEVRRTMASTLPDGYRHDRLRAEVGSGEAAWQRAREAIRLWKAHQHAGITVTPPDAPLQPGTTVLASRQIGPATIVAPCRVVYVTDEPTRFGFAYGTLPGHPEQGEEAFHVAVSDDGQVIAEVVAFSRPADLLTRLSDPVARQIQKMATRRYLEGIKRHVHG